MNGKYSWVDRIAKGLEEAIKSWIALNEYLSGMSTEDFMEPKKYVKLLSTTRISVDPRSISGQLVVWGNLIFPSRTILSDRICSASRE